ncbi:hypothetical protein L3X38_006836 [Prunus dulcis]|uniref:Retrotransposon gag domain-containing protein n=1 Tax=Prunus dulcis TaxID=3755 RepID=A0AAD5F5F1_PRUDU|nr:hypothetical protein L3X38_006836 [Prunus dulcis]
MITNTIRAQYGGPSQDTFIYSKPYTKRLDNLRMPTGYQPPKFMQFDGKGNPKQHVAHFIEMCNSAGTNDDYLVKQFVRSLRGTAFNWYIDLEPESIDSWEQMKREFLNRFYSTRRSINMLELTSTKQRKDEPVVDYINHWRSLSLDCKDRVSELSAVEMCIQGFPMSTRTTEKKRELTYTSLQSRAKVECLEKQSSLVFSYVKPKRLSGLSPSRRDGSNPSGIGRLRSSLVLHLRKA